MEFRNCMLYLEYRYVYYGNCIKINVQFGIKFI